MNGSATPPERPHYLEGQFLRTCDLVDEQAYLVEKRRQHEFNLHDGNPAFDESQQPGTGTRVVAAAVCGPAGHEMALEPVFAFRVSGADGAVRELLAITAAGRCELAGGLNAQDVTTGKAEIGSLERLQTQARPWNCYRPDSTEGQELRIELEPPLIPGAVDRSRFVVGTMSSSESSSDFVPVLTVDAGGNTAVRGRLRVRGPIVHADPEGSSTNAAALGVSLRKQDNGAERNQITADITVVNLSSKLISALTIVLVVDSQKPKPVPCQPFLKAEGVITTPAEIDGEAEKVTAIAFGVLPGGVLCQASGVLDLS
ncbi:hypothetical protein [Saccharopolyspora spinosa]|uniref:Uncharacterized protein n=2 Tax=Saccharopolyspora spinosa TaxID=60894 RepID=A0A2N3Y088_SACSN|nr:hypothetical protein [Saccharopolyspora spinosa]PKW16332.1 hypothetical protein A8926_4153 [Saccharopolyspora spinosa]